MKIAFLVDEFPCISETFILDQITGMIDLGQDVEILSINKPSTAQVHPDVEKYRLLEKTHYIPKTSSRKLLSRTKALSALIADLFIAPIRALKITGKVMSNPAAFSYDSFFLASLLIRKKYDIVHAHFGPMGNRLQRLRAIGVDIRFLTTFHGYDINMYPRTHGENCYQQLFARGKLFTANTQFTKDQMVKHGCDENKIEILPVGLRIEKFKFTPGTLPADGTVNILTVGRLVEKKGYEYAIRAFAMIADEYKVKYTIAGSGPLEDELKELVGNLGINEKVVFTGPLARDEIIDLYQKASIFLLTSVTASTGDMEGQGLVLQEAQATGLPVISTLHNGIPDGVLDGRSGYLVPEKDPHAIAEKLRYLIENPDLWPEMGKCGRQLVEEKYNIQKLNRKLLAIYKMLCQKNEGELI